MTLESAAGEVGEVAGRPGGARQVWLDLARGIAVVSMIVAHTSPWGGLWNISEYLTAPLFAFLVGISLHLAWVRSRRRYRRFVVENALRGALLVLAGQLLQSVYFPIIVVLQTLGVLTIMLAPVVPALVSRAGWGYALSVAAALLSPVAMEAARLWLGSARHAPALEWLVATLAAGHAYRVTTFVALAAAGIASAGRLAGTIPRTGGRGIVPALALLALSVLAYVTGRVTPIGAEAYSGTTPEIVGAVLLSASVTAACWWLVGVLGEGRTRRWLGVLVATGRMALSAYALQILALALIVDAWDLRGDDHWAIMTGVTALCLLVSWAWLELFPIGLLEVLLRLPGRALDALSMSRGPA